MAGAMRAVVIQQPSSIFPCPFQTLLACIRTPQAHPQHIHTHCALPALWVVTQNNMSHPDSQSCDSRGGGSRRSWGLSRTWWKEYPLLADRTDNCSYCSLGPVAIYIPIGPFRHSGSGKAISCILGRLDPLIVYHNGYTTPPLLQVGLRPSDLLLFPNSPMDSSKVGT